MAEENTVVTKEGQEPSEPAKTFTQEEVNDMIEKRLAKYEKAQAQKIEEAQKLAQMNEADKAKYQIAELQKKVDAYERDRNLSEMGKTARGMLREANISVTDSLVDMLITENAETTKQNVETFTKLFNSAVEEAVKEKLKGAAPKKGTNAPITKEQIMAVKDRTERQNLIREHMNLFK